MNRDPVSSPAARRNRAPILEVLREVLGDGAPGTVLEVASGTGEHAVYLAPCFPDLAWQPSDTDPDMRASIRAWSDAAPSPNLRPPLNLDAQEEVWPVEDEGWTGPPVIAILCINMIHIAPWAACLGLLAGAGRILGAGGTLYLYGPFARAGRHTAPSNEAFDASLRARNPDWGVRDLDRVAAAAASHGLVLTRTVEMPANNLSVIFGARQSPAKRFQ